jgi:hypothetical protein
MAAQPSNSTSQIRVEKIDLLGGGPHPAYRRRKPELVEPLHKWSPLVPTVAG